MEKVRKGSIKTMAIVALAAVVAGGIFVYTKKGTVSEDAVKDVATDATKVASQKSKEVMEEKKEEVMDAGKKMIEDGKEQVMEKSKEAVSDVVDGAVAEGKEAIGAAGAAAGAAVTGVATTTGTAGTFEDYAPEKIGKSDKVIIDFAADWCPSCRALEKNITANATKIPEGVTILKADFDKEEELKKKYGVTQQHTFVQVDSEGAEIAKWSGGNTLESLLAKVQ